MIGSELYATNYHKEGKLSVEGLAGGYGFSVAASVRDMLVGDHKRYLQEASGWAPSAHCGSSKPQGGQSRRVPGVRRRAHHSCRSGNEDGGHTASAPLPTLRPG